MGITGIGIGRGIAIGRVARMAAALEEPSETKRDANISAQDELNRVTKSLAWVTDDLKRRACQPHSRRGAGQGRCRFAR